MILLSLSSRPSTLEHVLLSRYWRLLFLLAALLAFDPATSSEFTVPSSLQRYQTPSLCTMDKKTAAANKQSYSEAASPNAQTKKNKNQKREAKEPPTSTPSPAKAVETSVSAEPPRSGNHRRGPSVKAVRRNLTDSATGPVFPPTEAQASSTQAPTVTNGGQRSQSASSSAASPSVQGLHRRHRRATEPIRPTLRRRVQQLRHPLFKGRASATKPNTTAWQTMRATLRTHSPPPLLPTGVNGPHL
jgi:hypothetical protein